MTRRDDGGGAGRGDDDLPPVHLGAKLALVSHDSWRAALLPQNVASVVLSALYLFVQTLIALVFAPAPPPAKFYARAHVAVIGAGVTGISTAAHLRSHGIEVTLFDENDELGGIWARTNTTSGLQLNSLLYRWHPATRWSHAYPKRPEILSEMQHVADRYGLRDRTRLGVRVTKVERAGDGRSGDPAEFGHARWIVNGDKAEVYDAVVASVGTCGEPKVIELPKQDGFKGVIVHSSQLDGVDLAGKRVAVVGAGASAVEAAELALSKSCRSITVLARSAHWIIPRNVVVGTLLALQPLGRVTFLSPPVEWLLKKLHYRSAANIAPIGKPLFSGTPIVNDAFLDAVRDGRITFRIGDVVACTPHGVKFSRRANGTKPGSAGRETVEHADVVVVATGFKRPSLDWLPEDLFASADEERDYNPPCVWSGRASWIVLTLAHSNLYLQNFATADWSVLLTNAAYRDAIGTVGHVHIGIYARILALFLVDKQARPLPKDVRGEMLARTSRADWLDRCASGSTLSGGSSDRPRAARCRSSHSKLVPRASAADLTRMPTAPR